MRHKKSEKEQEFKKEYFAMKRRLLEKGYGLITVYQLIENALISNYGKTYARRRLRTLKHDGCGDTSII